MGLEKGFSGQTGSRPIRPLILEELNEEDVMSFLTKEATESSDLFFFLLFFLSHLRYVP